MKSTLIPWAGAALAQMHEYQRVMWFGYGLLVREHLLNLNALSEYWHQACLVSPNPIPGGFTIESYVDPGATHAA